MIEYSESHLIDGQTLIDHLSETDTIKRIKNAENLIEAIQLSETGQTSIDTSSITQNLSNILPFLKSWINCSNPKVSLAILDLISLIADSAESETKQFIIFLKEITVILFNKLSDKRHEVRASIICLLNNFITVAVDTNEAQSIIESCEYQAKNNNKIPLIIQSYFVLLQDVYEKPEVRKNIVISRLIPFVLQQYANTSSLDTKKEALNCIVLFYKFTGNRLKNDIVKRSKNHGYDLQRMDVLYRHLAEESPFVEDNSANINEGPAYTSMSSTGSRPGSKQTDYSNGGLKSSSRGVISGKKSSTSSLHSAGSSHQNNKQDLLSSGAYDKDSMVWGVFVVLLFFTKISKHIKWVIYSINSHKKPSMETSTRLTLYLSQ